MKIPVFGSSPILSRSAGISRAALFLFSLLAFFFAFSTAFRSQPPTPPPEPDSRPITTHEDARPALQNDRRPDIVLITVECLRSDRLRSSGYPRSLLPNMEHFFSSGVHFRQAFSTASWTLPSLVSLLSSKYPFEHGITRGQFRQEDGGMVLQATIPADLPWLPSVLQKAGFRTFGFSTSPHTIRGTGFERGFDHYEQNLAFKEADIVKQRVLKIREEIRGSRPFFLWLHYFDPHWQYFPKSPWIRNYAPKKPPLPPHLFDMWLHSMVEEGRIKVHDPLFDYLQASYDSEINYWDLQCSDLIREMDLAPNTIFILSADHGEGFLEHQLMDHGNSLYEELIHVPLIIRWSGHLRSRQIEATASLIDVAPTLLSLAGIQEESSFRGLDWSKILSGSHAVKARRIVFSQLSNGPLDLSSAQSSDWKCILDENTGEILSYDRKLDPRERHHPAKQTPNLETRRFLSALSAAKKAYPPATTHPAPRSIPINKKTEDELRALGYVQ